MSRAFYALLGMVAVAALFIALLRWIGGTP